MRNSRLIIHTDGGSRGNPGPAAAAFVVKKEERVIHQDSFYLGKATNNLAEYTAVLVALKWLERYLEKELVSIIDVEFYLDSELVVKQINGIYKIKDANLKKINLEINDLLKKLSFNIYFYHVPRENNKDADHLVNIELDRN